jgi:type IV secretion system protein VirB11
MHYAENELLAADAVVRELFRPLAPFMAIPGVTEIAINRPREVYTEAGPHWTRHAAPELSLSRCQSLANAIASYCDQRIDQGNPLLSARLPGTERIHIVLPPVAEPDTVSMTIRIPDPAPRSFDSYRRQGFFTRYQWARPALLDQRRAELDQLQQELVSHLESNRLAEFIRHAVRHKLNMVVVGDTGSGKTSLMKAACQYIPEDERLVTIEDVRELALPRHLNHVHLLYSKGTQGTACVTPADLIACTMRMKPDRVLLAELRGSEAFDFLKLLSTGHSGSLSTFHAESCALALERYVLMCKEHTHATIYDAEALKRLVALTIDVIIHIRAERIYADDGTPVRKERYVSEVSYDPLAKLAARFGGAAVHRAGRPR